MGVSGAFAVAAHDAENRQTCVHLATRSTQLASFISLTSHEPVPDQLDIEAQVPLQLSLKPSRLKPSWTDWDCGSHGVGHVHPRDCDNEVPLLASCISLHPQVNFVSLSHSAGSVHTPPLTVFPSLTPDLAGTD